MNYYGQRPFGDGSRGMPGGYGAYASVPTVDQKPVSWHRRTLNLWAILLCFFIPCILYAGVTGAIAFNLHYDHPLVVLLIVVAAFVATLIVGAKAASAKRQAPLDPSWLHFLFFSMLMTLVLACICGSVLYRVYLSSYYTVASLNHYVEVDPTSTRGQELMDAGYVVFNNNTFLDLQKSMGFMNDEVYCVAPVARQGATMDAYDFWAVGTGCCDGGKANFHCGDYATPNTFTGLRVLSEDDRPFYRLAVQQAEAAHKIKASHPLFFEWTYDAPGTVNGWWDDGCRKYLFWTAYFFAFQFFFVLATTLSFQKHA